MILYWHDGKEEFPHGAGPSELGWYVYENGVCYYDAAFEEYRSEASGPFEHRLDAIAFAKESANRSGYGFYLSEVKRMLLDE